MPGISKEKLETVRKALELGLEDDVFADVSKGLDGLVAQIEKGETVTAADLSDILGDVIIDKAVTPVRSVEEDVPQDPFAPIFKGLYEQVFEADGTIKKGLKAETAQELLQKAYEACLNELDGAIEGAVEATAAEFGKASKKPPVKTEGDGDGDMDDMEKLLKSAGVSPALIRKVGTLQNEVNSLKADRDLQRFTKMAEEMGEGAAFGKTLMALSDTDPEAFKEITKRLTAKNALLKQNKVWAAEVGEGGTSAEGATAVQQLTAHAEELRKTMKRADGKAVSFAKAFTQACNDHPDIYAEYQKERR